MKIDVRFVGLEPSDPLRHQATRRVHFHLSRYWRDIGAVHLRISDVNGPRGGVDKKCQVTVRGRFATVLVADRSRDAYAAVDMAVKRAGRAVARALERTRAVRTSLPVPGRAA
jgi:ribosome-associated translation inhibitor RaiA